MVITLVNMRLLRVCGKQWWVRILQKSDIYSLPPNKNAEFYFVPPNKNHIFGQQWKCTSYRMFLHRLSTAQVYIIYMSKYIQYKCPSIYNINAQVYWYYFVGHIVLSGVDALIVLYACFKSIKTMKNECFWLIVCANSEKLIPLHRQKVNRLFRLVVIDLGF